MKIIMLCGSIGAGKSTFATQLSEIGGMKVLRTSELLHGKTRIERQEQGDIMDKLTQGKWVSEAVEKLKPTHEVPIIVDSIRNPLQVERIREKWPKDSMLIGIRTQKLMEHIESRKLSADETKELLEALKHPLEQNGHAFLSICDVIFDNSNFSLKDVLSCLIKKSSN